MLLTVQIVNYKSRQNLAGCLSSISRNFENGIQIQVIVVNNDDEKIKAFINTEIFPFEIKVVDAGSNIGFGRAHNLGAKYARGEYILFLNPDTKVFPKSLAELVKSFSEDPSVGIVGPLLVGESGSVEEEHCGFKKTPLSTIAAKVVQRQKKFNESRSHLVDWVSGGAMMVRRNLFEKIGGFDENYFMYFEDVDLCNQAKEEGYKILINPKAKVFHKSGQSFSKSKEKKKFYYSSQDYYLRKNFGNTWAAIWKFLRIPFYIKNVWMG